MMQNTPQADGEEITDLSELAEGDTVLFGDRTRPLTVTQTDTRTQGPEGDRLTTGVARVEGDWQNAVPFLLLHVTRTLDGDTYEMVLEKQEQIVACKRGMVSNGEKIDLKRVSRGDC